MKFAMVEGERMEPSPGLIGTCSGCGKPTVSKCGKIKIHHWAHKSKLECDPWWENETEWHRRWKGLFPITWQEVVHRASSGEFHRADIKTDRDWVIEIQYSAINPLERTSRNDFYGKLIWIVHGLRRKKDPVQFFHSLKSAKKIEDKFFKKAYDISPANTALVRDWHSDRSLVFFDFNAPEMIWCLLPRTGQDNAVVVEMDRKALVDLHLSNSGSSEDVFAELFEFASSATSAEDLFLKFHCRRREEDRQRQLAADEARRRNPYLNRRGHFRL